MNPKFSVAEVKNVIRAHEEMKRLEAEEEIRLRTTPPPSKIVLGWRWVKHMCVDIW
jgi:hypothetical protein